MPDYSISFSSFGEYMVDMEELETDLQRGGLGAVISIEATYLDESVTIYMNPASLYILGFEAQDGDLYVFNDTGQVLPNENVMNLGGAHGALGTWGYTFAWADIAQVFANLNNFDGVNAHALRRALSFLVVSISEALRYTPIREGIVDVINNDATYTPFGHHGLITSWRNNSRYNSREVRLLHPERRGEGTKY